MTAADNTGPSAENRRLFKSLTATVASALQRDLVAGRHLPGAKLPIVQLAKDYGVSTHGILVFVRGSKKEQLGLPKDIEGLIVAGRHYSATESAQKLSREIPPCMSMGQSAGVAAALAIDAGLSLASVDPRAICSHVRKQGGDPGDGDS